MNSLAIEEIEKVDSKYINKVDFEEGSQSINKEFDEANHSYNKKKHIEHIGIQFHCDQPIHHVEVQEAEQKTTKENVIVADLLEEAEKEEQEEVPLNWEPEDATKEYAGECTMDENEKAHEKAISHPGVLENFLNPFEVLTEKPIDSTEDAEEVIIKDNLNNNIDIENIPFEDTIDDNRPMTLNPLLFRSQNWNYQLSTGDKKEAAYEEIKDNAESENYRKEPAEALVSKVKKGNTLTKRMSTPSKMFDLDLPEFDPEKFTPGYVPETVKKGDDEYMIVIEGVQDTGLCGKYWGDVTNLSSWRRSRSTPKDITKSPVVASNIRAQDTPAGCKTPQGKKVSTAQSPSSKFMSSVEDEICLEKIVVFNHYDSNTELGTRKGGLKRKLDSETPDQKVKKLPSKDEEQEASEFNTSSTGTIPVSSKNPTEETSKNWINETINQPTVVSFNPVVELQKSVSCIADNVTLKEVSVECLALYEDHKYVNIGKEGEGMAPDSVLYAKVLRPPYHLLSSLKIKGNSIKGRCWTDKNTMVFVVLEGEIVVNIHTTQFNAKKGDSFYIPSGNYFNLINQEARGAELFLIQFHYDGPLPAMLQNKDT